VSAAIPSHTSETVVEDPPCHQTWLQRLSARILWLARIRRTGDRLTFHWTPGWILAAIALIITVGIHLYLLTLFVSATLRFPYLSPSANVEEAGYTYITGKNFRRFGFLYTLFLQDFSSGASPADHPFVYTHMPAGPDILQGLLFIVSNENYAFSRIVFAIIFLLGLVAYWRFAKDVLNGYRLSGAIFCVLILEYWYVFNNYDRQPYSPFGLLAFTPLVALQQHYRSGRQLFLWLTVIIAFVSSLYLEYNLLAGVLWCWILLWLTQIVRVDTRHAILVVGAIVGGIGLHLLQNFLFLGPAVFLTEFQLLIGNRMIGVPTQEEIRDYYQDNFLAHHGARGLDLFVLLRQLMNQITWETRGITLMLLGITLAWKFLPSLRFERAPAVFSLGTGGEGTRDLAWFGRLWIWILGTVLLPNVMFPAFNQDVAFSGARSNMYFIGIGVVAVAAFAVRQIATPIRLPGLTPRSTTAQNANVADQSPSPSRPGVNARLIRDLLVVLGLGGLLLLLVVAFALVASRRDWYGVRLIVAMGVLSASAMVCLVMLSRTPLRRLTSALNNWVGSRQSAPGPGSIVPDRQWRSDLPWVHTGGRLVAEVVVRAVLVLALLYLVRVEYTLTMSQLAGIRSQVATFSKAKLGDLRAFAHQSYMTNVNAPVVGFLVDEVGFAVCDLESLPAAGGLDPAACHIQYFRQREYWLSQTPSFFFFFTAPEFFPGFGRCLPSGTGILVERGGDSCIDEMRARLAARATEIHDNGIFTVFDLKRPPDTSFHLSREVLPPRSLTAAPAGRRAVALGWNRLNDDSQDDVQYYVERKELIEQPFSAIAVMPASAVAYVDSDLVAGTRYFYRVRACQDDACSPYVYAEARTPT
jgi:hypothetical protein